MTLVRTTRKERALGHPVMWFEVLGNDAGKLRDFYSNLFGWTFDVIPQVDYGVVKTGDTRGVMDPPGRDTSVRSLPVFRSRRMIA